MDYLSKLTKDQLSNWLQERQIPQDVVEEFQGNKGLNFVHWYVFGYPCLWLIYLENEMDGDALVTLIGVTPGPDCLKNLISKVEIRMKVYQHIKALYASSPVSQHNEGIALK